MKPPPKPLTPAIEITDKRSDDLTEIACLFADATDDEREVMLRVCRAVPRP